MGGDIEHITVGKGLFTLGVQSSSYESDKVSFGNPPKKNEDKCKGVETLGAGLEKRHEETLTDSDRQSRTRRRGEAAVITSSGGWMYIDLGYGSTVL